VNPAGGTPDPFALSRFVAAQDPVYAGVRAELAAGRKASHWIWFVFPQLAALGRSRMAQHYGIGSAAEALFGLTLAKYCGGRADESTLRLLAAKG